MFSKPEPNQELASNHVLQGIIAQNRNPQALEARLSTTSGIWDTLQSFQSLDVGFFKREYWKVLKEVCGDKLSLATHKRVPLESSDLENTINFDYTTHKDYDPIITPDQKKQLLILVYNFRESDKSAESALALGDFMIEIFESSFKLYAEVNDLTTIDQETYFPKGPSGISFVLRDVQKQVTTLAKAEIDSDNQQVEINKLLQFIPALRNLAIQFPSGVPENGAGFIAKLGELHRYIVDSCQNKTVAFDGWRVQSLATDLSLLAKTPFLY